MNEVSDDVLVARTRAGETTAYGALVSRYENAARVPALKYVRDHHVAEDVVQQPGEVPYVVPSDQGNDATQYLQKLPLSVVHVY